MSRALLSGAAVFMVLLAGCSAAVTGRAVRTPPSGVEATLPNSGELGQVLNFALVGDGVAQVGGMDTLGDDKAASSPLECVGVMHAGDRQTYRGAPLRAAAREDWTTPQGSDDRIDVVVSVAQLESPSDAQSFYTKTAAQWRQCQGVTVTEATSAVSFIQNIRDISDSDGTLTAELSVSTDNGLMTPGLNRRAFTATSQYLIDVEVFGTLRHQAASNLDASAVAHMVVAKIT